MLRKRQARLISRASRCFPACCAADQMMLSPAAAAASAPAAPAAPGAAAPPLVASAPAVAALPRSAASSGAAGFGRGTAASGLALEPKARGVAATSFLTGATRLATTGAGAR